MSNNWFDLFGFTEVKMPEKPLKAGDIIKFEGQYWEIAHPIGNSMRLENGGHFVYLPKLRTVEVVLIVNNKREH